MRQAPTGREELQTSAVLIFTEEVTIGGNVFIGRNTS